MTKGINLAPINNPTITHVNIPTQLLYNVKVSIIECDPVSKKPRIVYVVEGENVGKIFSTLFGDEINICPPK